MVALLAVFVLFSCRSNKYRSKRIHPPPGGCCFIGTSLVATPNNGQKPIRELNEGDQVLTYDFNFNQTKTTTIKKVLKVYHDSIYDLKFEDAVLNCTDDHPVWVKHKGWASINPEKSNYLYRIKPIVTKLEVGDSCVSIAEDNTIQYQVLEGIKGTYAPQMTYSLGRLKEGDSFFVNGVLVACEEPFNFTKK